MNEILIKRCKVPIETISESNRHEHWLKSFKRHTKQKDAIKWTTRVFLEEFINQAVTIKLIRISPRKLDSDDNLPMAFKWIKDAIADILNPGKAPGRADDSPLIKWQYGQEKGQPKEKAMRIEIYKET